MSTTAVLLATKLSRIVVYLDCLLPIKVTLLFDHVVLQDHTINKNHYIFTVTVPMATKVVKMVMYLEPM